MSIVPNVPPKVFTASAIAIGYLLLDDLTANEQNALGNWLMLVAQVLCTNAFYNQVQAERSNQGIKPPTYEDTLNMIKKMADTMYEEVENIRSNINT